jgi:hypothetical protein
MCQENRPFDTNKNPRKKSVGFKFSFGSPKGIRTPVTAVKGRCPRPLDDGTEWWAIRDSNAGHPD